VRLSEHGGPAYSNDMPYDEGSPSPMTKDEAMIADGLESQGTSHPNIPTPTTTTKQSEPDNAAPEAQEVEMQAEANGAENGQEAGPHAE